MHGDRPTTPGAPLRIRAPISDEVVGPLWLDALVHRSGDVWVVELEPQREEPPLATTLREVRSIIAGLGAAGSIDDLLSEAVRTVRELTGFDRVMVYRFDADWNGEVVAESKRADLEPFRGLHYPASDIPPQARALYTRNWLRFIRDVDADDAALVPELDPITGAPLDLSLAALRSVSPIHKEYLRNMGVSASMSVSLVISGELAGLIACHHYSGPYVPNALVRSTCEFLAQALSMMVAERERDRRTARSAEIQKALASVVGGTRDAGEALSTALAEHAPALLGMVGASGMSWTLDGATHSFGKVPGEADLTRLRRWVQRLPAVDGLAHTDRVPLAEPAIGDVADIAAGVLMLQVAEDQDVLFFRPEVVHTVDWGGNPHLKVLRTDAEGASRLSPRGSFALWRETVHRRSAPWEESELEAAAALRTHLVQLLYERNRALAGVAETLQRSLLPNVLPSVPGWALAADYLPASVGVGGDWYDVLPLPTGRTVLVVGDVAGHGLVAAEAMAQLRNALRAYAFEDGDPVMILARLDALTSVLTPDAMATAVVVRLDPPTGELSIGAAGHPSPVLVRGASGTPQAGLVAVDAAPPLGVGSLEATRLRHRTHLVLEPGDALLLVTDGMFERRDEAVDLSLEQLARHTGEVLRRTVEPSEVLDLLVARSRPAGSEDDATLLFVRRLP
jgi:serine phosphatase RsbU (regulator of sigma subunit)